MWTCISQAFGFAREGGKVQGADTGWGRSQGWGQVKVELTLGQGSRDTRQEVDGGDARCGRGGVGAAEQICVLLRACREH